ncbi:MAG: hypothetical protein MZV70_30360 [Desulfobacterales bacterium]|nr:hypothetical protein [Desulfobacterales bacterium]
MSNSGSARTAQRGGARHHPGNRSGDPCRFCPEGDLPRKVPTADWVRIIKEAHGIGLRSTATIMYGSCETTADQVEHLGILRNIQDETHGFTELVTLPVCPHQYAALSAGDRPRRAQRAAKIS